MSSRAVRALGLAGFLVATGLGCVQAFAQTVIFHRGWNDTFSADGKQYPIPENSDIAIQVAAKHGAKFVEVDSKWSYYNRWMAVNPLKLGKVVDSEFDPWSRLDYCYADTVKNGVMEWHGINCFVQYRSNQLDKQRRMWKRGASSVRDALLLPGERVLTSRHLAARAIQHGMRPVVDVKGDARRGLVQHFQPIFANPHARSRVIFQFSVSDLKFTSYDIYAVRAMGPGLEAWREYGHKVVKRAADQVAYDDYKFQINISNSGQVKGEEVLQNLVDGGGSYDVIKAFLEPADSFRRYGFWGWNMLHQYAPRDNEKEVKKGVLLRQKSVAEKMKHLLAQARAREGAIDGLFVSEWRPRPEAKFEPNGGNISVDGGIDRHGHCCFFLDSRSIRAADRPFITHLTVDRGELNDR